MTEKMPNQPSPPSQPWMASVLTLFPDMFPGPLAQSLAGKALAAGLWSLKVTDIRPYGVGVHHKVDDPHLVEGRVWSCVRMSWRRR